MHWQETLARFDGFIFVVAEYNHSLTGALKNALDHPYKEWSHKPFTAIGYGAARAIEHMGLIGIEMHMVSTHAAVHIGGSDFFTIFPAAGNQPIETIEQNLIPSATTALDDWSGGPRRPWPRAPRQPPVAKWPNRPIAILTATS